MVFLSIPNIHQEKKEKMKEKIKEKSPLEVEAA